MNKKSMSDTLVVVLIFVIGAIILLSFGSSVASKLKEDSDIETCRLSVLAQAQTRKPIGMAALPKTYTPLDCPRRSLKIFENNSLKDGK